MAQNTLNQRAQQASRHRRVARGRSAAAPINVAADRVRARRDLESDALACLQRRRRGPIHDDDERALAIGAVAPRAPDLNDACGPGRVRVCVRRVPSAWAVSP